MLTITSSPQLRPGVYKQMSRHTSPVTIPTNREIWPSSFISTIGYHIKFCEVLYLLNFREAPIDTSLAAEIITMKSVNLNSLNKMEINTIVSTTISSSENLKRLENTEYVYRKYQ